jgi:hypothetical protein
VVAQRRDKGIVSVSVFRFAIKGLRASGVNSLLTTPFVVEFLSVPSCDRGRKSYDLVEVIGRTPGILLGFFSHDFVKLFTSHAKPPPGSRTSGSDVHGF